MITEKGKAFIARNFGVNNCYALDDVVSCTVYSKGAPSERVLDTPTIVFLLVTDIANWVRTSTGRFTLADLVAANEGNYISMSEALDIAAYCIPGAAPPTAPTVPLTTPAAKITKAGIITELRSKGAIDIAAVSTVPAANKWYMYYRKLNYHSANFEKVIEISNIQTRNPPTQVADIAISENRTSVSELDSSWVLAKLAELPYAVTPTVPYVPLTPPPGTSKDIEILNPSVTCDSRNCDVKFNLKNNSSSGSAYVRLEVDGVPCDKRYVYILTGATKPQVLSISITDLSSGYHNLTIVVGIATDTDTYTHRFLVAAGIEPPAVTPAAASITKAEFLAELNRRGAIDLSRVSTVPGDNKWFLLNGQVIYQLPGLAGALTIGRIPPTSTAHIQFLKNGIQIERAERAWALARIGELPFTGAPAAPKTMTVTVDSAIPLWIWDEDGEEKLPCTRYNAMAGGTAFGITVCKDGYDKMATLIIPHTHIVPPFTMPFDITLSNSRTPVHLHGRYTGTVYIDGGKGEVHVKITSYPTPPTAPTVPLTTPAAKITKAGIITELRSKGAIDTNAVSTVPAANKWYMYYKKLNYHSANFEKVIEIANIQTRNPPTQVADIALAVNRTGVSELDRDWVLARIGELPFKAPVTPPTAASITKAEFLAELNRRGAIDLSRVSTVPGDNKWFLLNGQVIYQLAGLAGALTIGRIPPTSTAHIQFLKNGIQIERAERAWALARIGELPFTGAPAAPPATAVEPPTAIKAWIVANYGDGTRVTSDGGRKLNVAKMANLLAALPSGYSKGDITEGVVLWAMDNPNWESATICAWIDETGVTRLTEDHGLYLYNLAVGWTTLANRIYGTLNPKPSKPSAGIVTEDNGLGVYDYAIGWKTIANRITGCNF